jgi:hypothetical protein
VRTGDEVNQRSLSSTGGPDAIVELLLPASKAGLPRSAPALPPPLCFRLEHGPRMPCSGVTILRGTGREPAEMRSWHVRGLVGRGKGWFEALGSAGSLLLSEMEARGLLETRQFEVCFVAGLEAWMLVRESWTGEECHSAWSGVSRPWL